MRCYIKSFHYNIFAFYVAQKHLYLSLDCYEVHDELVKVSSHTLPVAIPGSPPHGEPNTRSQKYSFDPTAQDPLGSWVIAMYRHLVCIA